jgi:hypothetical protein
MTKQVTITHAELCMAVAKRYNKKIALYEYKSFASREEPDVLIFDYGQSYLFEIKVSLADFKKDQKKKARKKYVEHYHIHLIQNKVLEWEEEGNKRPAREFFKLKNEFTELFYIQNDHLGNRRYYVCPWGLIPVELVPEAWGLLYYKNGKFYQQKASGKFRSNLKTENDLVVHALRRYASGDNTGILVNTYGEKT